MKKCFVIMGFGKKMDYQTGKLVDLDSVYKNVIKPLFNEENGLEYQVIRGDEILTSELIDVEMYDLLYDADLVIADITTLNPNALYELGVRHALRPASTIIIAQRRRKDLVSYPFDLNHCRIFSYNDCHNPEESLNEFQNNLKKVICTCNQGKTGSPVYTYLKDLQPPKKRTYKKPLAENKESELQKIIDLFTVAKEAMENSEFLVAIEKWKTLHELLPHYTYVTQQFALAMYKSKRPNEREALERAWLIINKLPVDTTLDVETLGIAGAICKRLYIQMNDNIWLERAKKYYQKGFINCQDYYNGENYANCLMLEMKQKDLPIDTRRGLDYLRKDTCKKIIDVLQKEENEKRLDKWQLATMSNCYLHLQDENEAKLYQEKFLQIQPAKWEIETFNQTKNDIYELLNKLKL